MLTMIGTLALVLVVLGFFMASGVVRYISNSRVGVVEKLWSGAGSIKNGLIALNGEAGFQPEVLRGGFHFFFPFQYRVRTVPLVTIPQGRIGYVFARDGLPLEATQTLASNSTAVDFQDVRVFLASGGQKGPQRKVLREGTYAINLAQFVVLTADALYALQMDDSEQELFSEMTKIITERDGFDAVVIRDGDDKIGVVTVHDGPALPSGEIIAPTVGVEPGSEGFHNNFQDPEKFLVAGGFRGRQLQVLVEGSYYINRLFATVELINKTVIEVGTVGVVVSYTGQKGTDSTGAGYKHGELVPTGCRGVWAEPLLPGKYAFNTYAGKVIAVPTTNFILKWADAVTGSHKFDENLKEIDLITRDAFEPRLPLSVVVHIDYKKAPMVVQRFGDIKRLVEQTLDPMVSAYFKNVGQTKTLIELLQERSDIQLRSSEEMRAKFDAYNLELLEVLIGTPKPGTGEQGKGIETLLTQLRDRQIAVEQVSTYRLQEEAAVQERTLRQAQATAEQQTDITKSELSIQVKSNEGKALKALATQQAETTIISAEARAKQLRLEGEGEANAVRLVGQAEADATKSKVDAYGGPEFQLQSQVLTRFAEAIENGKIAMVPQIQVGGSGEQGGANALTQLLTVLMAGKMQDILPTTPAAPKAPVVPLEKTGTDTE